MAAIFGPASPHTRGIVASITSRYDIPHIEYVWRENKGYQAEAEGDNNPSMTINMFPDSEMVSQVSRHRKKNFTLRKRFSRYDYKASNLLGFLVFNYCNIYIYIPVRILILRDSYLRRMYNMYINRKACKVYNMLNHSNIIFVWELLHLIKIALGYRRCCRLDAMARLRGDLRKRWWTITHSKGSDDKTKKG